jgi:hypothetical protein
MKSRIRFSLLTLALLVSADDVAHADKPTPPARGQILVLDNDRTLEGDIERVGEQYRIRWATGEMYLPASRVRRLCANKEDAYVFLRSQANLNDPDERLRLARWCDAEGMRKQAVDEVTAAVQLRPKHALSRRLLEHFQRLTEETPPPPSPPPVAQPDAKPAATSVAEVSAECVGQFTTRVQPILMNACCSCHGTGKGGEFKLMRVIEAGSFQRRSTQQNLAAVLAQVNLAKPESSPLLSKAASAHGEMVQAPLHGRQAVAYKTLQEWVYTAAGARQQMREADSAVAESKPADAPPAPMGDTAGTVPQTKPMTDTKPVADIPMDKGFTGHSEPVKPAPARTNDPFDPAAFNQQVQREKK